MPNAVTSRTFSIAVSRAMFPVAHLVAYFVRDQSEIVSDALTFYINYTNLNNVYMLVNRGKDLNQDTIEIKGFTTPGAYLAFNVMHGDLYKFADKSFLREIDVSWLRFSAVSTFLHVIFCYLFSSVTNHCEIPLPT